MNVIWGILGIFCVLSLAFLLSNNKKRINIRTIIGGLLIQLSFAFIVLKWETGQKILSWLALKIQDIINYTNEGIGFLFGGLIGNESIGFIFAFQVLTVIIFFSSLISVLYYLGIMQWFIKIIGGGLSKLLGTSQAESMSAAANIFVGQTEAPLVIRPYIAKLTQSELFAVMTGGLASIAGSVLIGYSLLGIPLEYLLAASFMAAPAGLIIAKIIVPETETVTELGTAVAKIETKQEVETAATAEIQQGIVPLEEKIEMEEEKPANVIDAAARGASDGLMLALNVGAMLLAFIALIALMNGILSGIGGWFGFESLSLELILGYIFAPIAFVVGVPWNDVLQAGSFIGQKIVLNEFVAYAAFAPEMENLSAKTNIVVSFALCGFANLGSLAILIGGLGGLAPNRRKEIANFGIRAVIAGSLASLLSAAIAGMLL
ncbi:nucleoside transporter NupC [Alkalihalobacillus alcalophilus ATCC 27647 = CGMCC 1.3604]|uniref:Transporter n=1 Tax=Alkalihalobacillus alcalophilus ATCC 27647 = CGMCC 1.3604 TaxID=1218173 RepID=J8TEH2_ALKAL|nr:NupC/NupG family nucleoside CNT transporter [Alkalihalobacillus alcalophilus]AFV25993.1 sodium ion:nucleoside symporter transporter [Alkalihalobacillus alcalophilus ATCC 27647 = CGMCC 1.3604]KGA95617.1 transporter [Alkalihalobacillus alcalophilus ATCC 27647 = CGMCC 1.3604]MED1562769.1 NupC/NupG family nucleoside CNT transporter [Alkalihalobacillus alcalophilus]THG90431.1 nucleoside transporter NupC [Alkalihalobacillus alcalophilus ATCC 27647 = CGMCC 1.3604]